MISNLRVRDALAYAAVFILVPLSVKIFGRHFLDASANVRISGVLMGALVIVWGNLVPKTLVPLARASCNPAREQALRRFAGWALVLGGLGYAAAFAFAPIDLAPDLAIDLLAPAVVLVIGVVARCAWMRRSAR